MAHRSPWLTRLLASIPALALLTFTAGCSSPSSPTSSFTLDLSCPTTVAAQSIDGAAVAVAYSPAAIGGTAPVTVACNPASGSSFAPGTSTVTCTASDAAAHTKTCAFAVTVSVPPRLTATSFLAFGDSMTAGEVTKPLTMKLTVVESASYPTRLKALLTARYTAQTISMTNAGKPGERASGTHGGVTRLPGLLAQDAPAVVLLMEGVNDLCIGAGFHHRGEPAPDDQ
jgi:hypothetical protein